MIRVEYSEAENLKAKLDQIIGDLDPKVQAYFSGYSDSSKFNRLLSRLTDGVHAVIEYPYVDKVYRDSYYSYFSSKMAQYPRDTIKVSFFSENIEGKVINDQKSIQEVQDAFLGFCVIRPTPPKHIGRNILSPKLFKDFAGELLEVVVPVTVNHMKLNAAGFPDSSQNSESMTCAESSAWALIEFFGNKYPEYCTVAPSQIHQIVKKSIFERQFPSKGLAVNRLSYIFRKLGFGPRVYAKEVFDKKFHTLMSIYIESGVPILIGIRKPRIMGHAMLLVGKKGNGKITWETTSIGNRFYRRPRPDTAEFISIDDNMPPYSLIELGSPCEHYPPRYHGAEIFTFIAPLHSRLNLEAHEALVFIEKYLEKGIPFQNDQGYTQYRLYIASSRTYKNYIRTLSKLDVATQDKVVEVPMGKLIWVCELWKVDVNSPDKIDGIIVLDATEATKGGQSPILTVLWDNRVLRRVSGQYQGESVHLQPFNKFTNLKTYPE